MRPYLPPHTMSKTAGDLRYRITIQVPTETADSGSGQPIPDWADDSTVWGDWVQTGGSETVVGEQTRSIIQGIVTVRANSAFVAKRRLKINGYQVTDLIVNIDAVQAPDPTSGMQDVMVTTPAAGITQ